MKTFQFLLLIAINVIITPNAGGVDLCADSNPCKNGGQCSSSSGIITCQCLPGFRGDDCSIAPILVRLVGGNYTGSGRVELYYKEQWGTVCDDSWDNMDAGVICRMLGYYSGGIAYSDAYFGKGNGTMWQDNVQCLGTENDITECHKNAWGVNDCSHDEDAGVSCPAPCDSNPCKNGGQCSNSSRSFTCQCPPGFRGNDCSIVDPCDSNPCKNGAWCSNRVDRYACQCRPGFRGDDCSIVDPCDSNPCKYGGQCSNSSDRFTCQCRPGFRGNDCSILDPCGSNPCQNDGQCFNRGDRFTCQCRPGFRGDDCSMVDPCRSNPCKNGGQCSSTNDSFTCQCRDGFQGMDCSTGCGELFDIMFLIEESGGVGMANFIKIKNFVKGVVSSFRIAQDGIRVGLITFSTRPRRHFRLKDYQDVGPILGAIDKIPFTGGGTRTDVALNWLRKWGFRPKTGGRPGVPNIAVVILNKTSRNPDRAATRANQLRQTGATVFAVGIGTRVAEEELGIIASSPSSDYVFTVDSVTGLDEIKGTLVPRICSEIPKRRPGPVA